MENAIEIKNLTKNYGRQRGIENINLEIPKGIVYGFIGPNGAGKSTTIKCIMNMIRKNSGEIIINGKKVENKNYEVKQEIGYLPSEIHLYEDLTVKKLLKYSASFYKKDCTQKTEKLVKRLEIDINKKIEELSLGNLKKVGITLALMHDPQFIIMDEATSGLDPLMQEEFYKILEEEKAEGKTIFFSSHILNEVKRICDKVAIIKEGKIVKIEDIESLEDTNIIKVKIEAEEIEKLEKELEIEQVITKQENKIEFLYSKEINSLIEKISKYKISKLLIQEIDIEEIFMHYYK